MHVPGKIYGIVKEEDLVKQDIFLLDFLVYKRLISLTFATFDLCFCTILFSSHAIFIKVLDSQVAEWQRILLPMQGTQGVCVPSLGWEDRLEEEMAAHSSTLDWRTPWTEEAHGLRSTGAQSQPRLSEQWWRGWGGGMLPSQREARKIARLLLSSQPHILNILYNSLFPISVLLLLTVNEFSEILNSKHGLCGEAVGTY